MFVIWSPPAREALWRDVERAAEGAGLSPSQRRRFVRELQELAWDGPWAAHKLRADREPEWRWLRGLRDDGELAFTPSCLERATPHLCLLLNVAAYEAARGRGRRARSYAALTRQEKSAARNLVVRQWLGLDETRGAPRWMRVWGWVCPLAAWQFREVTGRWPSYSMKAPDGGPEARLVRAAASWVVWPCAPRGVASVIKVIKACRRGAALRRPPRAVRGPVRAADAVVELALRSLAVVTELSPEVRASLRRKLGVARRRLRAVARRLGFPLPGLDRSLFGPSWGSLCARMSETAPTPEITDEGGGGPSL